MNGADEYMTAGDAAASLGVERRTISRLIARGELPAKRDPLDARVRLVRRADVERIRRETLRRVPPR